MTTPTKRRRVKIGAVDLDGQVFDINTSWIDSGMVRMAWIHEGDAEVARVVGFVRGAPRIIFDEDQRRPWPQDRDAEVLNQVLSHWRAAGLPIVGEES
jgi:hypothetical protein